MPILAETSLVIADPQVRYLGTLGGNVAGGDPGNDMPAVMMCLGATYHVVGKDRERRVPARDFYQGAYVSALEPGEIVTAIRIPAPTPGHGYAYEKLKRKIGDYATAAAAVVLTLESGAVATCSIGLTNVAETPFSPTMPPRSSSAPFEERSSSPPSPPPKRSRRRPPTRAAPPPTAPRWPACWRGPWNAPDPRPLSPRSDAQTQIAMSERQGRRGAGGAAHAARSFPARSQNLTGPHIGCETSHCGACTIDLDGKSVKAAPSLPSRPMAPKS